MKIVLVIYIVSWCILAASKLSKGKIQEDDKSWGLYIIAVLIAPIVALSLIYIMFESYFVKKKSRRMLAEREKEQKILNERRKIAFDLYLNAKNKSENLFTTDLIDVANELNTIIHKKEYSLLISTLNRISLPAETYLEVEEAKQEGRGDRSRLYIDHKGVLDTNIWEYINVDNSPSGAWQVYLLHILWHSLPLFWHDNYNKRSYIHSPQNCNEIVFIRESDAEKICPILMQYDLTPYLIQSEDKYYISSYYWSNWGGLQKELVEITVKDNKVSEIFLVDTKTEYDYDCKIRF